MRLREQHGAATAEHVGVTMLVALALISGIAAVGAGGDRSGRELGSALARKIRCAAVGPGPCWRDPLTEAYGRPVAGVVRALAPSPLTEAGLLPVDFRRCRIASCAMPGARFGLTASNRRVTEFVSVADRRPSGGPVEISYWLYRPTIGWERIVREASSADVVQLASTPLLETAVPALVALETLDGRNQYDWPTGEEPPWRWEVDSVYP